jgi:hypothetical protein
VTLVSTFYLHFCASCFQLLPVTDVLVLVPLKERQGGDQAGVVRPERVVEWVVTVVGTTVSLTTTLRIMINDMGTEFTYGYLLIHIQNSEIHRTVDTICSNI